MHRTTCCTVAVQACYQVSARHVHCATAAKRPRPRSLATVVYPCALQPTSVARGQWGSQTHLRTSQAPIRWKCAGSVKLSLQYLKPNVRSCRPARSIGRQRIPGDLATACGHCSPNLPGRTIAQQQRHNPWSSSTLLCVVLIHATSIAGVGSLDACRMRRQKSAVRLFTVAAW